MPSIKARCSVPFHKPLQWRRQWRAKDLMRDCRRVKTEPKQYYRPRPSLEVVVKPEGDTPPSH